MSKRKGNNHHKRALNLTRGARLESWDSWGATEGNRHARITDKFGLDCNTQFFGLVNKFPRPWRITLLTQIQGIGVAETQIDESEIDSPPCRIDDLHPFYEAHRAELDAELTDEGFTIIDRGWRAVAL